LIVSENKMSVINIVNRKLSVSLRFGEKANTMLLSRPLYDALKREMEERSNMKNGEIREFMGLTVELDDSSVVKDVLLYHNPFRKERE